MCKCDRSGKYWCDFGRSRYSGFVDDSRYPITCELCLTQFPRLLLHLYEDRHILMGWHIHHIQPVTPREVSVKQEVRANITHDYCIHDHPLYFVCPDLVVAVCETSYGIRG
jgi:hypothetical protein